MGKLRILIAGGGTGGHIIPALAIGRELTERYDAEIRFVGTARGLETRLVPQAGYPLDLIQVGQLNNVSLLTRVKTLLGVPLGLFSCFGILRRFRPQVVVGVGGYASGPAMLAAILSRIPTLAFEPNAMPGLVNRWTGKWVSAAAVNFGPAKEYFRNAEVTGIPVRREFFQLQERNPCTSSERHLLVFGGSQGARILNTLMPAIAVRLLNAVPGLTILHQAGARHAEKTQEAYAESGADPARWQVHPFLDDMPSRFEFADLVLSRSGASTVAELAAAGKASLLIPFAAAADDHQRKNAEVLVEERAAALLTESEATPESLLKELQLLFGDPELLQTMGQNARAFAHPDAAERIARTIAELAK
jgi:UDP-N-acetylglucosamine--N-acetylmuramyl-(pentapeptide) pyrophosphoryl-undecaprenol N-acetylglucosamine transferase